LSASDGAVPSPNIWQHPEIYELENRAVDQQGRIEAAMRSVLDWTGRDVLDLGCGTGFHLPRWAYDARSVVGV
jgi:predicted RNA methylase